ESWRAKVRRSAEPNPKAASRKPEGSPRVLGPMLTPPAGVRGSLRRRAASMDGIDGRASTGGAARRAGQDGRSSRGGPGWAVDFPAHPLEMNGEVRRRYVNRSSRRLPSYREVS